MQEVCRVRSTKRKPFKRNLQLKGPIGKEQIHRKKLNPHFLDKYPLQAKKAQMYKKFKTIVAMVLDKEHLKPNGLRKIQKIRQEMRAIGKKARTYGNR